MNERLTESPSGGAVPEAGHAPRQEGGRDATSQSTRRQQEHPKHNSIVERDIDGLRELVLRMAALAQAILDKSLRAAFERDPTLGAEVDPDDLEIDRLDVEIDRAVLRTLALQAPVASDLRLVVAIHAMTTDLERIGDLARNIAGCARRLCERTETALPDGLRSLADESRRIVREAIESFADLDPDAARAVIEADDAIDDGEDRLVRAAIDRLTARPETSAHEIDVVFIAQNLERIADHATNIAEEVVLATEAKNLKHVGKLAGG